MSDLPEINPNNMENATDKADAPVHLAPVITPEVLAENAKKQEQWKKQTPIPDFLLSPAASWQKRDYILQRDLSRAVYFLEEELLKIPEKHVEARNRIIIACERKRDELAEIYARWGEFGLAAQIAATPARQELYKEYFLAEQRGDLEACCFAFRKSFYFERYPVKSQKYGDRAAIVRCGGCGFRNIRVPTKTELEKLGYG